MERKIIKRALAIILSVLLIVEILPLSVLAEEYLETQKVSLAKIDTNKDENSPIIGEIIDQRDCNRKVYKHQDGSFTAVISDAPMHYYDDGEWKEIDNTLSENNGVISNESNSFFIEFPSEITSENDIMISTNDSELSFSMNNILPSEGEVKNKEQNNVMFTVTDSSIEYENILSNTDLKYEIGADSVKESIRIDSCPKDEVNYSYKLSSDGNVMVLNNDGSVTISSQNGNVLFEIQKPYMFDSNNAYSGDIITTLSEQNDGTYILTYTPDYSWLTSSDRNYPVTVDPTTRVYKVNEILDALVGNYNISNEILQNYYEIKRIDNEESKLYLKLDDSVMSSLGNNAVITNAELSMYCRAELNSDILAAYAINENWTEGTTTEVTKDNEILDYNVVEQSSSFKRYVWNITEVASEWILNQRTNNGIAIESIDDNDCATLVEKSSATVVTSHRPWFEIDYITIDNAQNYDSETIDMGRAGVMYLNKYTGTYYV